MPFDTGIASRLRKAFEVYPQVHGERVRVRELDGWKQRTTGVVFNPKGALNHHTAGHPTEENPAPSLGIVRDGRSDLSGPLANMLFAPLNLTWYVVAAGACNHGGTPDNPPFHGMQFNADAYSLEVEWDGLHTLPMWVAEVIARGWSAVLRRGDISARMLFQHWEWAPSRKVDFGTNMHDANHGHPTADEFRGLVGVQKKKLKNPWAVQNPNSKKILKVGTLDEMNDWIKAHKDDLRQMDGLNLRPNI